MHRICPILARHDSNQLPGTYYIRLYNDLVEFSGRGVSFGGFSGVHGASGRAQSAE